MSWLRCNMTKVNCGSYRYNCTKSEAADCIFKSWSCHDDDSCPSIANPDISGQGVLISFFVTALLTFTCAWAMLLLDATFRGDDHKSLSVLDRRFIWAVGWWKNNEARVPVERGFSLVKWKLVLQKVLPTLSDAHLLTELAILIAGFSQACSITLYHYHAVVYLAWTSSSVHMVTLTISRFYLRSKKFVLVVRLVFMSILFMLLFVALCFTASPNWPTSSVDGFTFDAHAACTLQDREWSYWRSDTIFALILISLGYVCRLCKVFETSSASCQRWLRTMPEDMLKRLFTRCRSKRDESTALLARKAWLIASWATLAFFLYARAFYDIYESLLVELIWMTLSLLWGFAQIFSWAQSSPLNEFEKM